MNNKLIYFDGRKSIELDQYPNEAWRWLSGNPDTTTSPRNYFKSIPWLYRGVELRAQGVATMPFVLYRGETEFDTSTDWQNKIGFIPNPVMLLWLIEACLTLEPACYLFRERSDQITKRIRYILPDGVEPKIDPLQGLTKFTRYVQNVPKTFKPVEDIIYFWRPDPYTEQYGGPGSISPGKAALMAAGVLANIDEFVAGFFKRGAIKATLFGVKGNPAPEERLKLEDWLTTFMTGVRNAFRPKVINADAITATVIGEGLESLEDKNLTASKREDISTALGIPQTKLFSSSASGLGGGGVVSEDDVRFYKETIEPECGFIGSVLNEQIFAPLGYRFDFQPETLDVYQEDEAQRASSLSQLTTAGIPLLMALDLLGYELTNEQRAELELSATEKKEKADKLTENLTKVPAPPEPKQPMEQEMREDMKRWRRKAMKLLNAGKGAFCEFESDYIPEDVSMRILAGLKIAQTEADLIALFSEPIQVSIDPVIMLATELKRANDYLLISSAS